MDNQPSQHDAELLERAVQVLWQHGYSDSFTEKLSRLALLWKTWDSDHCVTEKAA